MICVAHNLVSSYVRVSIKIKKYNPRTPLNILSKDDDVLFAGLDRIAYA